jgi:two-component system, cell cycle sensor histidine kinase and response regulator CckA
MPDNLWQRSRNGLPHKEHRLPPRSMPKKKADLPRETILVADDDYEIRALIRMFLEHAGYTVVTADDGEEGLRVYKKHQPSIALLLTDVRMPKMNGVDLADRVLQLDSHLPVLFMSGDAPGLNLRSLCLAKPFNSADLAAGIAQVLHASDTGQERERLF